MKSSEFFGQSCFDYLIYYCCSNYSNGEVYDLVPSKGTKIILKWP